MSDVAALLESLVGDDEWSRHQVLERLKHEGASVERIRALGDALADPADASRRSAARMALSALGSPDSPSRTEARAVLGEATHSEEPDLRVLAASALGESGNHEAVPDLVRLLEDPESNVVAAAADALGELGAVEALDALVELAASSDLWLRTAAVVALGRLYDTRALPTLREVAETGGLDHVTVEALARINDPAVLPVLGILYARAPRVALHAAGSVLCSHPDVAAPEWVRAGAREAEGELRERLVEEDDPATARLLGVAATPTAVATLLELVGPPRRSEAALTGLLATPPGPRADAVLGRLAECDAEEQGHLLSLLPPLTDEDRIRPLISLLGSEDRTVRAGAAEALARVPAERALPLLASEIDRGGVAPEVVRAMGSLGATACHSLTPLLDDPQPEVRAAAAEALTRCGGPAVLAELQESLAREREPAVRRALLVALGHAGGAEVVGQLAEALRDPDAEVRLAAIEGLGATGSELAVEPLADALGGSTWHRLAALRALGDLARAGIEGVAHILDPHLSSGELDIRRAAARAAIGAARALSPDRVEALVGDPDPWIRACVARLLARRGTDAREPLARMASSDPAPEVRAEARRWLERER